MSFWVGCIKGDIGENRLVLGREASVGGRWCAVRLPFGGSTTTAGGLVVACIGAYSKCVVLSQFQLATNT